MGSCSEGRHCWKRLWEGKVFFVSDEDDNWMMGEVFRCLFVSCLSDQHTKLNNHKQHSESFYEAQENHNLIGVANVFLECLFHDIRLQYAVPIISQQGEVREQHTPTQYAVPMISQQGEVREQHTHLHSTLFL
uniref:Kinesin-like KIF1-type domain-containing protein n=1 Tax=Oncorhynchus tshawytscha TaxID=74940 RepID=A0AAZ3P1R2_ONCTS